MRIGLKARAGIVWLAILSAVCGVLLERWLAPSTSNPDRAARPTDKQRLLRGRVVDGELPVAGATVRLRGGKLTTQSDQQGRFALSCPAVVGDDAAITASKEGYFIAGLQLTAAAGGGAEVGEIGLRKLPEEDCAAYRWVDPRPDPSNQQNCGNCHQEIYDEWRLDAHSRSARNRRLLNLYDGSDWQGRPDRGWNLLAEHPHGAGVCASCHAPTAEPEGLGSDDLRRVSGVPAEGVHCDACHKIQDVSVEHVGLTHGRFAFKWLRPAEGQIFFGPLDDVDRNEDVHLPLERESRFCASCHEGVVFGVPVYTTYSEWLASSARQRGKQCQSCHLQPTGKLANLAPSAGGINRDPSTLASHQFLPGGREAMLRRCLKLSVSLAPSPERIEVRVQLTAHDVGHSVPTGFIDRHLTLFVQAVDGSGHALPALDGPRLPRAAGADLADQPGLLFAKLLTDAGGIAPVPFWRAGAIAADHRLQPDRPSEGNWQFPVRAGEVRVRLWYRRFWPETAQAKGWPDDSLLVFDRRLHVE